MSEVLYVKTNKSLTKDDEKELFNIVKEVDSEGLDFYFGFEKQSDVLYFFDSMWIPFWSPLNNFKKSSSYESCRAVINTVLKVVNFLLAKNYQVKLYFAMAMSNFADFKEQKTITLKDMDENCSFDWQVCYDVLAE